MNVLERILEEIKKAEEEHVVGHEVLFALGATSMGTEIERIIRSHMNDAKDLNVPTNDGWIPVSERLPEDGTYLCTLDGELCGIDEPFTGMCGIENGKWDEEGCVIAWQPLPEPYRPEERNHEQRL